MFAFSIVCMVILAATQPAIPALLKPMLDGSFIDKDLGVVQQMAALMVLVFAVRGLAAYFSAVSMAWVAGKLVFDLRSQMGHADFQSNLRRNPSDRCWNTGADHYYR